MPSHLKKYYRDPFYRNSIAMMLNSAFSAFFGLLFWIVAARTMPSKDIGLATAAISAAGLIMGLSRLGLDSGLVRYLPESKNRNGLYSIIIAVTLVLSLILTVVFIAGIDIFSPALSFLGKGWFLPMFLAYIAISSVYSIQNMAFIAIRRADLSFYRAFLWDFASLSSFYCNAWRDRDFFISLDSIPDSFHIRRFYPAQTKYSAFPDPPHCCPAKGDEVLAWELYSRHPNYGAHRDNSNYDREHYRGRRRSLFLCGIFCRRTSNHDPTAVSMSLFVEDRTACL